MTIVDELARVGERWAAAEQGGVRSLGIWTLFVLSLKQSHHIACAHAGWTQGSLPGMAANEEDYRDELARVVAEFEKNRLRGDIQRAASAHPGAAAPAIHVAVQQQI